MKKNIMGILKGELIGLKIEIPAQKLKGTIINETKHTLEILTEKKQRKKIIKAQKLIIITKNQKILINGKIIEHEPENRIKKIK